MHAHLRAAAVLLLVAPLAAAAAVTFGGQNLPAQGPGRISVRRARIPAIPLEGNFRFDFDGTPESLSGIGAAFAYDSLGKDVLAEMPISWTRVGGSSCAIDLASPEAEAYIESLIQEATGATADVAIEKAAGKGKLRSGTTEFRANLKVTGTAILDGGPPLPLAVKLRLR
jgi:hypothetical protein